ncbi:hypothetical protein FI667_g10923, partial [Globisporangium splendens]
MSSPQDNSRRNELLQCAPVFADVIAPGLGSTVVLATSFFQYLVDRVRENEALMASQLMQCLGATWERIRSEQAQNRYLTSESAEGFVSLVEEIISYELECQQKSFPNPFSNKKKHLEKKVDALKDLEFERVEGGVSAQAFTYIRLSMLKLVALLHQVIRHVRRYKYAPMCSENLAM